jgi:hypothetical protein
VVKNKNVKDVFLSMRDVKMFLTFTSLSLVLLWQLFYLFCSSIVINTVIVTAGNFEPVFRLLTDFVCLYNYEFWLSLCKIARSSVILLLPLFICINTPAAPAYGVYISQLIRYSRACASYQDFLDRGLLLTRKVLNQVFLLIKLKSSLRKFYGRHHDLVDRYGISVSQMTTDMFHLS